MNQKIKAYLSQIEQVVENGPYRADWDSLSNVKIPDWYRRVKFGIFIHWGVYSVPAFGNEWYPRNMYLKDQPEFAHHSKTYGPQKEFGYRDFIPMFKAEKFDADRWMETFAKAGARYVVPVAEHHDGFQMYGSELSEWNAVNMGPHRDVLGELKAAAEKKGIILGASSHRAENCFFFAGGAAFDSGLTPDTFQEPYGFVPSAFADGNLDYRALPVEHLEMWLARTCELIDKYQPALLYFDWYIQQACFAPYLKKLAAYYYNRAEQWGRQVAIDYKCNAFPVGTAVFDVERGQLAGIQPTLWQTDTAIAKNSWCYTENNDFKKPQDIVSALVDIVSKNGTLLLNIGPRADGTFTPEDEAVLAGIGSWMARNGEAIYDTICWKTFGEGPTGVSEGQFTDGDGTPFTPQDIRFTCRGGTLYAFVMRRPADGVVKIKSLSAKAYLGDFDRVMLLENDAALPFAKTDEALTVTLPAAPDDGYPVVLKLTIP